VNADVEIWKEALGATVVVPLFASLVFWIWGLRRIYAGEPLMASRFRAPAGKVPPLVVCFTGAWILVTLIPFGGDMAELDPERMLTATRHQMLFSVGLLGILLLLLTLLVRSPYELVKLGFRVDHLVEQIGLGIVGFLAALLPVFLMLNLTTHLRSEESTHVLLRFLQEEGFGWPMLPTILLAVVVAPLLEELMFRVVLQSWLTSLMPPVAAILTASVIFAGVHGYPDSLAIFVLALMLGGIYYKGRSYLAVVLLHALFNAYNIWSLYVGLAIQD